MTVVVEVAILVAYVLGIALAVLLLANLFKGLRR